MVNLSGNRGLVVFGLIIAVGGIVAASIFAGADVSDTGDEAADIYFDAVGTEDVSQMDSPWNTQDLATVKEVHYDAEDQSNAGNATFEYSSSTTVDEEVTSYVNYEIGGDTAGPMELSIDYDDTGNFTSDSVNVEEVNLRDYDETDVAHSFDNLQVQSEDTVEVSNVQDGDYVLEMVLDFQSVDTSSNADDRDTIFEMDAILDSEADGEDDEPVEVEDFSYDVLTT